MVLAAKICVPSGTAINGKLFAVDSLQKCNKISGGVKI